MLFVPTSDLTQSLILTFKKANEKSADISDFLCIFSKLKIFDEIVTTKIKFDFLIIKFGHSCSELFCSFRGW